MNNGLWMLLFLFGLSFQASGQTAANGFEGSWQGTLEAGGAKLRLVLTVSKPDAGAYAAKLESLDQGATIPVDVITVNTDAVRLEMKSIAAVFEGVLSKERTELAGKFTRAAKRSRSPSSAASRQPPCRRSRRNRTTPHPPTHPTSRRKWR